MKTTKTISMAEFAAEVEKIAIKEKHVYYVVYAEMGKHLHTDGTTVDSLMFKCYVDGYSFFEGKTPNECLALLKQRINPKKSIIEEVLV